MSEGKRFTVVFEGDIRRFGSNPFHVDTPFGRPLIVDADDVCAELATLQREADGMREALVKVAHAMDTLIHEGVDRGKGHWPAWDDCARAVDAARAALNGPPQATAAEGSK